MQQTAIPPRTENAIMKPGVSSFFVGACVGSEGLLVGRYVNGSVGGIVGAFVGGVGAKLGADVGDVGTRVGAIVGAPVGVVGTLVGALVGTALEHTLVLDWIG